MSYGATPASGQLNPEPSLLEKLAWRYSIEPGIFYSSKGRAGKFCTTAAAAAANWRGLIIRDIDDRDHYKLPTFCG